MSYQKSPIVQAVESNDLKKVQSLLSESGGGSMKNSTDALEMAAKLGYVDMVKCLLPLSDPRLNDSRALMLAANAGHIDIIKILIPVSDPKAFDSFALSQACKEGHLEAVRLLLPVSSPQANDSLALRFAAGQGHMEIVKILLPLCDPLARESQALEWAVLNGHETIVALLAPLSDVDAVINILVKEDELEAARRLSPYFSGSLFQKIEASWGREKATSVLPRDVEVDSQTITLSPRLQNEAPSCSGISTRKSRM